MTFSRRDFIRLGVVTTAISLSGLPLPVMLLDDIEAAQADVAEAQGTISKPVFAFPSSPADTGDGN